MRIGSLFAGVGGLDLAVQAVFGGEHAWFSEIDPAASKVLAYRFPGVRNLGDITKIDWAAVEPVDVLCGGFPCQDVSAAGKRAGIKDGTRSGLWAVFSEAIDALRPQYVVIENVRGLLSAAAHRTVEDDAGDYLESDPAGVGDGAGRPVLRAAGAVLGDLADLGYDAVWATVAASDVGAPHRRERVFIVAHPADHQPMLPAGDVGHYGRQGQSESLDKPRIGAGDRDSTGDSAPRVQLLGRGARCEPHDASHPPRYGWGEGRPESAGIVGGFDAAVSGDEPGVALLPTPATQDGANNGGPSQFQRNTLPLNAEVTLLPTPVVNDMGDGKTVEEWDKWTAKQKAKHGNGNGHGNSLAIEALRATDEPGVALLPTPCAQQSGNSPEEHLRKKPGRKVVTDLAILVENGLLESGGALLPTPQAFDRVDHVRSPEKVADTDGGCRNLREVVVNELPTDAALLPTPNASDGSGGGQHPDKREGHSRQLIDYVLLCTPSASDGAGGKTSRSGGGIDEPLLGGQAREMTAAWGKYEPAIRRWEQVTGQLAPPPTEPNKNGNPRLSAAFSEWLMGWPAGWVTDPAIGISRNDQLRCVGNGVVSLQAVAAICYLLTAASQPAHMEEAK